MKPWVLVPVKRFTGSKSRLSGTLDSPSRFEFAVALFDHVVRTVAVPLCQTGDLGGVLVVTDGQDVARRADESGAASLVIPGVETGRPLGRVVDEGLQFLTTRGADCALVIMGDLPFLTQGDITSLTNLLKSHDLVFAPDTAGTGTNALALRLPPPMSTQFCGGKSLRPHTDLATSLGLTFTLCEREGFALDVDQPEDYARLMTSRL
ncbi:MAG: 2-phospho-L-lactate guanylyltransferase [Polyangiaceae bacterium]|nr:2-phospho-L-lactate guanylyltransferase [Polyangiaceae bacterium]